MNNGVKLTAIHITENDRNITPTIYIDDYYQRFREGMELEVIVADIMSIYRSARKRKQFDVSAFSELDVMKETFSFKLINYEKNKELLEDVPHLIFLDLAIVFYAVVEMPEYGYGTILIHNEHLAIWNITKEQLVKMARENAPKILPCHVTSMSELIKKVAAGDDIYRHIEDSGMPSLYILSNTNGTLGAAVMLYPRVLADFATACGSDLVILPSSVHEVILSPARDMDDMDRLNEMVCEVNKTQLRQEEILADHVYYYDRRNDEIIIPQ